MKSAAFDFQTAHSLADAIGALQRGEGAARVMAGGGSLGPMLNLRLARPQVLVDIRRLPELREIARGPDGILIGAGWTHAEIEDRVVPDVTRGFLPRVAGGIAYRPIRNRGTIGGSLAHADPAADWVSALTTLGATAVVHGPGGERRETLRTFIRGAYATSLADTEILRGVLVPALSADARWSYEKVCRKTGEFALAIGAVVVDPARGHTCVVCGAVEAVPLLLPKTAAALAVSTTAAIDEALAEIHSVLAAHGPAFRQLHCAAVVRALERLAA